MKRSFHWHNGITAEEAERLESHYRRQGAKVTKSLNIDPRFFDLAVNLPETKYLKPTPRCMRNTKLWG